MFPRAVLSMGGNSACGFAAGTIEISERHSRCESVEFDDVLVDHAIGGARRVMRGAAENVRRFPQAKGQLEDGVVRRRVIETSAVLSSSRRVAGTTGGNEPIPDFVEETVFQTRSLPRTAK